jgi:hypothetical protein
MQKWPGEKRVPGLKHFNLTPRSRQSAAKPGRLDGKCLDGTGQWAGKIEAWTTVALACVFCGQNYSTQDVARCGSRLFADRHLLHGSLVLLICPFEILDLMIVEVPDAGSYLVNEIVIVRHQEHGSLIALQRDI